MEIHKDDVLMWFDDYTIFISNANPNTLHFFNESSVVRTTGNIYYGSSAKGSSTFQLQKYASNVNYTINLLHSKSGLDYFNVVDGASNSMKLIQIFADVVDVNNDKIANGFQPLFIPGNVIMMDNFAFHHCNMVNNYLPQLLRQT